MSDSTLRLFAGRANRPLAEEVSQILEVPLGNLEVTRFPDSEVHVLIGDCVRGCDVFVVQPCSEPVNDHLMELVLLIDAFRRASATSITAVVPYFPYARQERMARGREAVSARVVATLLEAVGVDRVIYCDIHVPALQGFFTIPVDPLTAVPILAEYFENDRFKDGVVVSPDVGRAKLAGKYAELLGLPLAVMHKRRSAEGEVKVTHVVGDVKDRIPIVIDDLIASGSILDEVPALVSQGAQEEIYLAITHPVLLPSALERLQHPLIKELVVTNTIRVPEEKRSNKLHIRSVAQLLADVIRNIHEQRSITPLIMWTKD
ncbi:MAG: ribose-phosphate diphosphokinase [Anaerolineae bacterium]